jgi:hypothetical protein
MSLVPYDESKKQIVPISGSGPLVKTTQSNESQLIKSTPSEGLTIQDLSNGVKSLVQKAKSFFTGSSGSSAKKQTKALPAPVVSHAGPLVVYQKPRYSTKRLRRYGNRYVGSTKVNLAQFRTFKGSGYPDPILF